MLVEPLYNYNTLFSRKTLRNLLNGKFNIYSDKQITYEDYFNDVYKQLSKHYRNEYFFKNTLLNRRLLGVHSINTSVALSELPIGRSIADFVLLNGEAIVYEIKTELDDFTRLLNQLDEYYKAFKKVYVVTAESKLNQLKKQLKGSPAGILVLRKSGSISHPIKKSKTYSDKLEHEALFKLLRKNEYLNMTEKLFNEIPNEKPVFLYDACFSLFTTLDIEVAYEEVMNQLKSRNIKMKSEFKLVPESIKSLVYFEDLSKKDYEKLFFILKKQVGD